MKVTVVAERSEEEERNPLSRRCERFSRANEKEFEAQGASSSIEEKGSLSQSWKEKESFPFSISLSPPLLLNEWSCDRILFRARGKMIAQKIVFFAAVTQIRIDGWN